MYTQNEIRTHILNHISDQSGLSIKEIDDARNFVTEGLLDSFATITLIISLESAFGIIFDPVELADESVQTVGGLASLVIRKQQDRE